MYKPRPSCHVKQESCAGTLQMSGHLPRGLPSIGSSGAYMQAADTSSNNN